jgi:conjugative relaxase-like TrwC/TraI family protein
MAGFRARCSYLLTSGRIVLTIAKLGVGQENYYLAKVAQGIEDYYTGQGEVAGAWMGRGAARLGLVGDVAGDELRAAFGGIDPTTGRRLAGREGAKRVPGWDLTFSAPKSVSVLFGLGGEAVAKEVAASHGAAVVAGLAYLEEHATVSRRRVDGEIEPVKGEGLVVAAFRHRTSRAGDPQLHSHALVANVVEHVDGGSGAIHSPVIYRHARTAGFIYQAVLRGELTERLGVRWEGLHNGYAEIEGMDSRLLEVFSKRRAEIEAALAERGEDSARAAQVAAHRTRAAKEYGVDAQTLHDRWAGEAAEVGVHPAVLEALLGRAAPAVTEDHLRDVVDELVSEHGLTAQQASFDHRDVVRAWCEALPPGTKVTLEALEDLAEVVEWDERVIPVVDGRAQLAERQRLERADGHVTAAAISERRWSTTEMLEIERRLLAAAGSASAVTGAGGVPTATVERVLAARRDLADEQAAMVRQLTTSGRAVDVVVGRAGTGKTYALAAAAEIWRDAGYRPVGLGLAARAAHELESTAGIPSTTLARFLIDVDQAPAGFLSDCHVLVVDEAGMVDTRRLGRLVHQALVAGAKVVLVGDHHQLPAVEAGGAFAALVARGEGRLTELTCNRRQRELWERDTLERLRGGIGGRAGIEELVAEYGRHGRLHMGDTPAEVRVAMVKDWEATRRAGASAAMIALRHNDVHELNARARALLVEDGVVDPAGLDVGERTFAVGDRVVCLDNDRRLGVHNAMFATVIDVDHEEAELVVAPDGEDSRRRLPNDYVEEHLDHAYATTIHKAQGATYDRVLILGDDRLYRQAGYAGLSRGRDRNDVYLVVDDDREHDPDLERHGAVDEDHPIERFVRALNRDGAKLMASDERDIDHVATTEPLSQLWARRDALVQELAQTAPADTSAKNEDALDLARVREGQAAITRGLQEERVERLRGARHRWERKEARRELDRALDHEDRRRLERERLEAVAAAGLRTDREWLEEHHDEVNDLADVEFTIVRRTRLAARAAEVDRPAHIVAVLGEPPVDLDGRERWRAAAGAIDSYSARWGEPPGLSGEEQEVTLTPAQAAHLESAGHAVVAAMTDPGSEAGMDGVEL